MTKRGTVVCSSAGRDKGMFMAVVGCDGETVTVCDGKQRPLERPKRKNVKHVSFTVCCLSDEQLQTNRSLRHALNDFRTNNVKGEI